MDQAGQKGTGNWTAREALELGVAASVFARCLSTQKMVCQVGARQLTGRL